jgi:hypothetical protein
VRTALEDTRDIRTIEREDDKHRYLVVEYDNGASVPSWLVSDGTLRLLALTIPAYLKDMQGVFLVEEPENGPGLVPRLVARFRINRRVSRAQRGRPSTAEKPPSSRVAQPKSTLRAGDVPLPIFMAHPMTKGSRMTGVQSRFLRISVKSP